MAGFKLEEAQFFLKKMKTILQTQTETPSKEFYFYLSALLQSCASVPDWLLFEYAEKYMHFTVLHFTDLQSVRRAAIRRQDKDALAFLNWWDKNTDVVFKTAAGYRLITNRHISTHLKRPPLTIRLSIGDRQPEADVSFSEPASEKSILEDCEEFVRTLETYVRTAYEKFSLP